MKKIHYSFSERLQFAIERCTNHMYVDFMSYPKRKVLNRLDDLNFPLEEHLIKYMIMDRGTWFNDWIDSIMKQAVRIRSLSRNTGCGVISRRELLRDLFEHPIGNMESLENKVDDLLEDSDYIKISPSKDNIDFEKLYDELVDFYEFFVDKFILNKTLDKIILRDYISKLPKCIK